MKKVRGFQKKKILYWMNHKLYLIPGRNNNNLRCTNDITVMAESEKELKRFLIREKGESEKLS